MSRRDEDDGFAAVLDEIDRTVDFGTSHYDDSYLDRRIAARIRRRDADAHGDYAELLRSETDEREALRPEGYLVIGMTETLPRAHRDAFEVVDRRHRIYRRRGE